jgi:hypothetical protein
MQSTTRRESSFSSTLFARKFSYSIFSLQFDGGGLNGGEIDGRGSYHVEGYLFLRLHGYSHRPRVFITEEFRSVMTLYRKEYPEDSVGHSPCSVEHGYKPSSFRHACGRGDSAPP